MNKIFANEVTKYLDSFVKDYERVCADYRQSTLNLDACDENPSVHEEKFMDVVTFGCDTDSPMPSQVLRNTCLTMDKLVLEDEHNMLVLIEVEMDIDEYMDSIADAYREFAQDMQSVGQKYGISDPRWQLDDSIHRSFVKGDERKLVAVVDNAFPRPDGGTRLGPAATVYDDGEWCKSRGLDHIRAAEVYAKKLAENTDTARSLDANTEAIEVNIDTWLGRLADEWAYNIDDPANWEVADEVSAHQDDSVEF